MKLTNGDHMAMECCYGCKCMPIAKHPNGDVAQEDRTGHKAVFPPLFTLHNFKWLLNKVSEDYMYTEKCFPNSFSLLPSYQTTKMFPYILVLNAECFYFMDVFFIGNN